MNNSLFEDLLKKKAAGFQPVVSPKVLMGVKLGVGTGLKSGMAAGKIAVLKSVASKIASTALSKAVVGVISVSVVTSGTILLTQSDKGEELKINTSSLQTNILLKEQASNTNDSLHINNLAFPEPNFKQAEAFSYFLTQSPTNNSSHELQTNTSYTKNIRNEILVEDNFSPLSGSASNLGDITNRSQNQILQPKRNAIEIASDKANTEGEDVMNLMSIEESQINYQKDSACKQFSSIYKPITNQEQILSHIKKQEVSSEKNRQAKRLSRFSIRSHFSIASSKLTDRRETNSGQKESFSGSMTGGGIALYYQLNKFCDIGMWSEYQKIKMNSKYTTNGEADGSIERNMDLLLFKAGAEFELLDMNDWKFRTEVQTGIAYKLKHKNLIEGKYFNQAFSHDMSKENRLSPVLDVNLKVKRLLSRNLELSIEAYSNYIHFNRDFKVLHTGGRIVIIYKI